MNKSLRTALIVLVAVVLVACSFGGGFAVGHFLPAGSQATAAATTTVTPSDLQAVFKPFWQAWDMVHQYYVSQPVDDTALMQGAIKGMLSSLDTGLNYYETPEEFQQAQEALNGKDYTGIGVWVDTSKDYLTIISLMQGSPAEQAGLKPGDQVIAVNGEDMTGVTPEVVRTKVLGPEGTSVTLTIYREGEQSTFDVTVTRANITPSLVEYRMLDNNIAYVHLLTFGDTADQDLRNALQSLLAQNPKGLIFDLRYNAGGYVDQGVAVASEFLPKDKIVVYEKSSDGTLTSDTSLGDGVATDIPMVVVVNEWTISAAEIVAGALQDYGRAQLVGATTYGKGTVQSIIPLDNNQGVVGVTIAEWLTPNQRLIQKKGITPDKVVEMTQADYDAGRDPQLDAAVQLLSGQ